MAHDVLVKQGALIGGRYLLQDRIADGGMGQVWSAQDQMLGRRIAVKTVKPALADDPDFADRFRREARLAATLNHSHIAQIYDYGEGPGGAYLVMEFVDGQPLSNLLRQQSLRIEQRLMVLAQAADALQCAHEHGVVHRDVKPANIMVTRSGEVKLTDFGIARALSDAKVTRTGEVLGTAHYLSPEAALGRPTGPPADIYSLGVVAYECIAGAPPFDADSAVGIALKHVSQPPPPLPPYVPPAIRDLVMRSLAKDPVHRQRDARELAGQLRSAVSDPGFAPATARYAPSPTPPPVPARAQPQWQQNPPAQTRYEPHLGAPPLKKEPSSAATVIGSGWLIAALASAILLVLPFATLNGQSYDAFSLSTVERSYNPTASSSGDAVGVLQLIICLVLAGLAVPSVIRHGHRAWPIIALFMALFAGLFWVAMAGFAVGSENGVSSSASLGVGWVLHGLVGVTCFGFIIAGIVRPR